MRLVSYGLVSRGVLYSDVGGRVFSPCEQALAAAITIKVRCARNKYAHKYTKDQRAISMW